MLLNMIICSDFSYLSIGHVSIANILLDLIETPMASSEIWSVLIHDWVHVEFALPLL